MLSDIHLIRYLSTGNNMNTIEMHLILSSPWLTDLPCDLVQKMVSYSIHVIVEYNQAGSEIICRQIYLTWPLPIIHEQRSFQRPAVRMESKIVHYKKLCQKLLTCQIGGHDHQCLGHAHSFDRAQVHGIEVGISKLPLCYTGACNSSKLWFNAPV